MRWQRDGFSVESAWEKGRPLEDDHWFYDKPDRFDGDEFFYEAFRDLQTERQTDGPIPWSKCIAYADRRRLSPEVGDVLWAVIRRMDAVERRWRVEELRQEFGGGG